VLVDVLGVVCGHLVLHQSLVIVGEDVFPHHVLRCVLQQRGTGLGHRRHIRVVVVRKVMGINYRGIAGCLAHLSLVECKLVGLLSTTMGRHSPRPFSSIIAVGFFAGAMR
tara:strand:+ start:1966 stop:2295 length:330 start_codon:yes stop_codon:yes gene_type:complete